MTPATAEQITDYHEQTKHHPHRYARSSGYMDWSNQPHPFRFYDRQRMRRLPFLKQDPTAGHMDLYHRSNNLTQPFVLESLGGFLELSLALSAWKAVGNNKWVLRINPSSGNLHPTEAHLILPAMHDLAAGVYHYSPLYHGLEMRMEIPTDLWARVEDHFQTSGFFCVLTSIFWRESWKYGERAFRYCNHDVGHALAALSMSANLFGWQMKVLDTLSDEDIETIIGLDRIAWQSLEAEHPDVIAFVHPNNRPPVSHNIADNILDHFKKLPISGRPNALSPQYVDWDVIYTTAKNTRKPATAKKTFSHGTVPRIQAAAATRSAAQDIRQRRSATAYDMDAAVESSHFLSMLDSTIARDNQAPFDIGLMRSSAHLALFVHNVAGLQPGLYFLLRNPEDGDALKQAFRSDFLWRPVTESLPLFLLQPGDFRMTAIELSCHQEIAGFSAFSMGMICRFAAVVQAEPYRYRHLFWETGMIGQVLYLEAETYGYRGTGIGCFFDDEVHKLLGIADNSWQSLYHFTVGRPVEDQRLTTLLPYHHLQRK